MPITEFEIRSCISCGLRYPLPISDDNSSRRCPACMGATRLILSRNLTIKPEYDLPDSSARKAQVSVVLDNIRSAGNVGSILRSADGFGFIHAYLCGVTPAPDTEAVKKTSLGAEETVAWTYHKNAVTLTMELKSQGWKIMALERHERSISLMETSKQEGSNPALLIVGNEIFGVDPHLLDLCNEIYYIPMYGRKKSFNVAVAFGIAAYALI